MIRAALCLLLSGCTVFPEHVQVLPTVSDTAEIGCCMVTAEVPPATSLSLKITKPAQSLQFKFGARIKF